MCEWSLNWKNEKERSKFAKDKKKRTILILICSRQIVLSIHVRMKRQLEGREKSIEFGIIGKKDKKDHVLSIDILKKYRRKCVTDKPV